MLRDEQIKQPAVFLTKKSWNRQKFISSQPGVSSSLFLFSNSFFGEDQKRQFFHGDSHVHKKRAAAERGSWLKKNRGTGFAITVENSSSQKHLFFKGKILIIKSVFKLFKQHELDLRKVWSEPRIYFAFLYVFYEKRFFFLNWNLKVNPICINLNCIC